ncbi:unnamed protein product [Durusdinium trenchii]|uniref:PDZ domain-containing protein n=1 Tax=Durusdinium trenchii TaxID=1381693 RepID=A0ABP0I802_9DINO
MRFPAVVDKAFAEVERQYGSKEDAKQAKKRIREQFRQAAHCLEASSNLIQWSAEQVMQSLAGEALQRLAVHDWFDQVDWAWVLAAFAAEATPHLGSEEQLRPVAIRAVQRWQARKEEQKLLLFGECRKPKLFAPGTQSEHVKELFAKFQGDAPTKMMSKRNQLHLDSGYKAQKPRARGEPKGADDAREIDIDLGFLQEVDSLGVSLQDLQVESTLPSGRSRDLLIPGDVVTRVNGIPVRSHQEFWREVERAKPGRVRVCVLPGSAQSKPPPPPSSTKPPPVAPLVAPPADPKSRRKVSAVAPAIEKLVDPKADSGPGVVLEPEPQSSSVPQLGALRQEGAMIVLNCEDIGSTASKCTVFCPKGDRPHMPFPWDAIRCAIRFYEELGFWPQPVCHQATMHRHPPPAELRPKLVQCPVMDDDGRQEGRGSDRIFVVNLAKTYACPFVDNSNYREQVWSGHEIWPWLQKGGLAQKVEYIFDSFGEFLPSREVAPQPRGQSSSGRLRIPWSEYGGR